MTSHKPTPLDLPLDGTGTTLIEASAGTGKTYALTTLTARLIVEAEREIGDLLIVTFTVAATDELRDRVRRTLRAALRAATGQVADAGDQAQELLARWNGLGISAAAVARRLEPAVADLDRANVVTIHGFCQRVVKDFAFECGLPFGFEVSGDGFDVVSAEVRDHWRRGLYPAPMARVQFARWQRFLPKVPGMDPFGTQQNLTDWVMGHLGKPALQVRGTTPLDEAALMELAASEAAWDTALETARRSAAKGGAAEVSEALETPLAVAFDAKATFAALAEARAESDMKRDLAALDEAAAALLATYWEWLPRARRSALEETRERVTRRGRAERLLGYDDLLLTVHDALKRVPTLGARIRRRYPFALIDEYQDTDGVQADIFQRVYGGGAGSMVIVGDPKQSIYRFRSADIFAYLRTSKSVADAARLQLAHNYRSVPRLVAAVNTVFDREHPFGLPEIRFSAATPAERATGAGLCVVGEEDAPPLQFRLFPPNAKVLNKNEAAPLAASHAADEIAQLLAASQEGGASVDGRPLEGSDIAVLVRTGEQGRRVAGALAERGVRSVEVGVDDVFASREAEQLERLLWAIASPHSPGRMRGALAGDLFGMDAAELARLADDDDVWNAWKERLGEWRATWSAGGVAAMLRQLLKRFDLSATAAARAPNGGARQLLRHPDGARRLTNVMHLADLLQQAEAAGRRTPAGLAAWFSRRRARVNEHDEVAQLRLESDEQLVKIVTVHRSKGLEFPIVFLPFAWDARVAPRMLWDAQFHVRDDPGFAEVLHLAPTDADRAEARLEDFSEEVRLLYVALTRGRLRCVVTWGRVKGSEAAPLAWLLHGVAGDMAGEPEDPVQALEAARQAAKKMKPAAWIERVEALVARCPEGIKAVELPAAAAASKLAVERPARKPLEARRLGRALGRIRQMTSYSALAGQAGAAQSGLDHEAIERPDHDVDAASDGDDPHLDNAQPRSAFTFPAGARVGRCLHEVFERIAHGAALDVVVGEELAHHRIDGAWREVAARMVGNVWNAPLQAASGPGAGTSWCLAELQQPLPELEFHLPARHLARAALGRVLAAHGYGPSLPETGEQPLEGYLRGFIDLVAEQDGCWYLIDYKTNLLGREAGEYAPPRLAQAVARHGYHLQYLLYLLALHRHLRLRLPGYAYEQHIGGVFYLFTRGVEGADAAPTSRRGIYFDRPSEACIDAMDACFAGSEAP